jgi:hypothetical protein
MHRFQFLKPHKVAAAISFNLLMVMSFPCLITNYGMKTQKSGVQRRMEVSGPFYVQYPLEWGLGEPDTRYTHSSHMFKLFSNTSLLNMFRICLPNMSDSFNLHVFYSGRFIFYFYGSEDSTRGLRGADGGSMVF